MKIALLVYDRFTALDIIGRCATRRRAGGAGRGATTHWAAMPFLARIGAEARPNERFVQSGKIITAAGVSAGIDMALFLAGQIAGQERAEVAQLLAEYDPQPPYQAGHISKASEAVRRQAQRDMYKTSITARESWALMRLLGRTFVSTARKKLRFGVEASVGR